MIVSKFGGDATANKKALENVKQLLNDDRVVWVFSAIGKSNKADTKITDLLIAYTKNAQAKNEIRQKIIAKFKKLSSLTNVDFDAEKTINNLCQTYNETKDKDWFISRGEYLTTEIMAKYLNLNFVPAEKVVFMDNGKINFEKTEKTLKKLVLKHKNLAIPGFYALNHISNGTTQQNKIKLFSRGGSDYSACIIAKCLGAGLCENWTNVDGIFPINPGLKKTEHLKTLSYSDLNIMANMDAKVIHKNCARLLNGSGTILQVRNIFNLNLAGTKVCSNCKDNAEFLAYKKSKSNCLLVQGLKNGGKICLNLPIENFDSGAKFLLKHKNQL